MGKGDWYRLIKKDKKDWDSGNMLTAWCALSRLAFTSTAAKCLTLNCLNTMCQPIWQCVLQPRSQTLTAIHCAYLRPDRLFAFIQEPLPPRHRTSKICHKHSPRAKICKWHGDSSYHGATLSIHNLITANVICDAVRLRTVSRSPQEVLQFRESDQQIQEFWFDLSLSL